MAPKARNQLLGKFARWITVAGNSQDKTVQACETLDSLQTFKLMVALAARLLQGLQ